jgi:hypothetical protein
VECFIERNECFLNLSWFKLAAPNGNYFPSCFFKGDSFGFISGNVSVYFVKPPLGFGFGYNVIPAVFMSVPKTTINKNYSFILRQNDIRFARQFCIMQPEPKSLGEKKSTYLYFGLGVFAPDTAHVIASDLLTMRICHKAKIKTKKPRYRGFELQIYTLISIFLTLVNPLFFTTVSFG